MAWTIATWVEATIVKQEYSGHNKCACTEQHDRMFYWKCASLSASNNVTRTNKIMCTQASYIHVHGVICASLVLEDDNFKSSTSDRTNTKYMLSADTSYSVHVTLHTHKHTRKFSVNFSFKWLSSSGWEITQLWHFKGQKGRKFTRPCFRSCRRAVITDRHQNVPEWFLTLKRHFLLYTSYHVRYKINKFKGKQKERNGGERMLKQPLQTW